MENLKSNLGFLELYNESELLKEQLVQKILYKDNLELHVCNELHDTYFKNFGLMEYEIEKYEVHAKKFEIEAQIIQEAIDDLEEIDIELLEDEVDKKYEIFEKELEYKSAQLNVFNSKEEQKTQELTEYESKEFDESYEKIIKKIHPYIKKEVSDKEYDYFFTAKDAYKNYDMDTLKSIELLTEDYSENNKEIFENSESKLTFEVSDLKNKINDVEEEISQIKTKSPYTLKEILDNEEKLESHKEELTKQLEESKGNYIGMKTRKNVNARKKKYLRY